MGYWEEEAVSFTGSIRRSGSSHVVTIPVELFQRFLLKEGQDLKIFGMIRRTPELHGMIGIFLGSFQVTEKYYSVEMHIKDVSMFIQEREVTEKTVRIPPVERVADKHVATSLLINVEKYGGAVVKVLFGCITAQSIIKPKTKQEVTRIKDEFIVEVQRAGGTVESATVMEEEVEWYMTDPSFISKSPYKNSPMLKSKWIL